MSAEALDVSGLIKAKSDQVNADDLIGGPITVRIEAVKITGGEQPVTIRISGGHMPVRPSKTMLRILAAAWGTNAAEWVGRWMTLHRDETVKWAGEAVGGIRPIALSHIDKPMTLSLATSKGKKSTHKIAVIRPQDARQTGAATANLDAFLAEAGLTVEQVDAWRAGEGKGALSTLTDEQRAGFASWLANNPAKVEAIRAFVPAAEPPAEREPGADED